MKGEVYFRVEGEEGGWWLGGWAGWRKSSKSTKKNSCIVELCNRRTEIQPPPWLMVLSKNFWKILNYVGGEFMQYLRKKRHLIPFCSSYFYIAEMRKFEEEKIQLHNIYIVRINF